MPCTHTNQSLINEGLVNWPTLHSKLCYHCHDRKLCVKRYSKLCQYLYFSLLGHTILKLPFLPCCFLQVKDTQNTALYYLNTLASSLTIAAFNAVLPTVFASLTSLEKWHTPGHEVKYTLMRSVSVYLLHYLQLNCSIWNC